MNIIVKYLRDSRQELAKVTWPTKQQTINSTILVVVASFVVSAFLGVADYGLNKLLEYLLEIF